jgi:lactate permease
VTGIVFGSIQFAVSNFHGPWVVDIAGGAAAIIALVMLLKVWQPKSVWRFADEEPAATPVPVTRRQAIVAWAPWVILSLTVFVWALPPVKKNLDRVTVPVQVPGLHLKVERVPPVAAKREAEKAEFRFNWLSATGTALLLSGIISGGLVLRVPPATLARLFAHSVWRVRWSLLTIAAMLALGYTTRYAGIDATMGLALASTGVLFPFFSPLLGWLGVALTGSDTSSNVLFGNLQKITAEKLGISPILAAAANSSGGVMGKMIDAQSIVVAAVATNQHNKEGEILRYVFFHSIALASLVGVLVWLQAGPLRWMIPH